MDYDFAILDLRDESDEASTRFRGWVEGTLRGFRDDRPQDEQVQRWLAQYRTDDVVVRGAWLPAGELGAGPVPVATYASFDKTLNAGRELIGLRMVTDVTTSPAHRRRGLLRRLLEQDLADAVAAGVPMAALTASEATIYGRWGFGPATFRQSVEVDVSPGFALRDFTDPGRVELLRPEDAFVHVRAVFDAFHARQRGSVEWPAFYDDVHSGRFDHQGGSPHRKIRTALHQDAAGEVDAFVIYTHGEKDTVRIEEMVALTAPAQLALWSFLGHMDRVRTVSFNLFHPEDPLAWALADLNRVRLTELQEFLWLRLLDVPRCLEARPWAADGTVVLEVDDPQGHTTGRYEVVTAGGSARVARTAHEADLRLTAETLGSLYLAGVGVRTLAAAGRVAGDDEAVRRFAAMADLGQAPYSLTGF